MLNVGGHTLGHVAFLFPAASAAFVGDALFALGCGRCFEGTHAQVGHATRTHRSISIEPTIYLLSISMYIDSRV